MYPHRIRLRGPWEAGAIDAEPMRFDLPGSWSTFVADGGFTPLKLKRRFGHPRMLDHDEHVYLVCQFDGEVAAALNNQTIQPEHVAKRYYEWHVTRMLQQRNEVELDLTTNSVCAAPEVALEIRGPVYLRDISPTLEGWTGQVVGEQRQHLEVHLLAQGRAVARVPVQANQSFALQRPNELPEGSYNPRLPPWTIELIEMANRWYSVDVQTLPEVVSG